MIANAGRTAILGEVPLIDPATEPTLTKPGNRPLESSSHLGYRPELDGLRGIAVLLVMAYHFYVPGFGGGGEVGVTIFFVLSGYLITLLLLIERRRTGGISVRSFYLRRVRRLLPALFAVVAVVVLLALGRNRLGDVGPSAIAVLLYAANWAQYGNPISLEHLSHAWSLAVEEQFYAVWPWVLIGLAGREIVAAAGLSAVAVGTRLLGIDTAGLAHIDGVMLGAILAVLELRHQVRLPMNLALLGVLVIALVTVMDAPQNPTSIAAGVATTALIGARFPLTWMPLVFIGKISYGLYLWHFVVGWEVWPHIAGWPWTLSASLLALVSFAFAVASWRYVEAPFRGGRRAHARAASARSSHDKVSKTAP